MMNEEPVGVCPCLGEMLAAREREPSAAAADAVMAHLRRCPACRAELETADRVEAICLEGLTAKHAERLARGAVRLRATMRASQRTRRAWPDVIRIAALVPLVVVGALAIYYWPTSAEALVDCAAAAERSRAAEPGHPLRARLVPRSDATMFKSWSGPLDGADVPAAVVRLVDRYGQGSELLRVEPYRNWRRTLPQPGERVLEQGALLRVQTLAPSASEILQGAELVVRADTCQIVGVTLLGPDYRVEVTRVEVRR